MPRKRAKKSQTKRTVQRRSSNWTAAEPIAEGNERGKQASMSEISTKSGSSVKTAETQARKKKVPKQTAKRTGGRLSQKIVPIGEEPTSSESDASDETLRSKPRGETTDKNQNEISNLLKNPAIQTLANLLVAGRLHDDDPYSFERAEKVIRNFDSSTDVDDWIKHFEREVKGLSHTIKMQLFRMKISGECFAWYNDVETNAERTSDIPWTIANWLRELKKSFKPTSVQLREQVRAATTMRRKHVSSVTRLATQQGLAENGSWTRTRKRGER